MTAPCAWCTRRLPRAQLTHAPTAHFAWRWWCDDTHADECSAHRQALRNAGTLEAALTAHHAATAREA